MKKPLGDIILNSCDCYFPFCAIFCLFTSLTAWKIKIKKKKKKEKRKKKPGDIIFYTSLPKIMIICFTVLEIWCMTDIIVIFNFGLFFGLLQPRKSKFLKNERNTWRYHHFTYVYQKLWSDDVRFLRYGVQWMDRRMDGKSDI